MKNPPIAQKRDGSFVHISQALRGRACDCICSICGGGLLARKGPDRIDHFAHEKNTPCEYAGETALHLAVKEILSRAKELAVPEYNFSLKELVKGDLGQEDVLTEGKVVKQQILKIEDVRLETKTHDIIPDVIVSIGGIDLIVEVFVSHKVDQKKLKKIRRLNIPAIEINANFIWDGDGLQKLSTAIIKKFDQKQWLYHPRQKKLEEEHKKKVALAKERLARKIYPRTGLGRTKNQYKGPAKQQSPEQRFSRLVELAGYDYFQAHGVWPDVEEYKKICDRIKHGGIVSYGQTKSIFRNSGKNQKETKADEYKRIKDGE